MLFHLHFQTFLALYLSVLRNNNAADIRLIRRWTILVWNAHFSSTWGVIFLAFSRKIVSGAFFVFQIETKLGDRNLLDFQFRMDEPMTQILPLLLKDIFEHPYPHACNPAHKDAGCRRIAVIDGIWKIGFRHCAAKLVVCLTHCLL